MKRKNILTAIAIFIVFLSILIPQWYLALHPGLNLHLNDFFLAVVFPIFLALLFFGLRGERVILFGFLAFIWSVSDDAPVYLDSIFTWPEVTSGTQHVFLELVLHLLTIFFLYLAVREALKGTVSSPGKILLVYLLATASFLFSYAQNIPLNSIRELTKNSWYQFDIIEHLISLGFFILMVLVARRPSTPPEIQTDKNKDGGVAKPITQGTEVAV